MSALPSIRVPRARPADRIGIPRRLAIRHRVNPVGIDEVKLVVRRIAAREKDMQMGVGGGVAVSISAGTGVSGPAEHLPGRYVLAHADRNRLAVRAPVRSVRMATGSSRELVLREPSYCQDDDECRDSYDSLPSINDSSRSRRSMWRTP